jgi:hypothetical protein
MKCSACGSEPNFDVRTVYRTAEWGYRPLCSKCHEGRITEQGSVSSADGKPVSFRIRWSERKESEPASTNYVNVALNVEDNDADIRAATEAIRSDLRQGDVSPVVTSPEASSHEVKLEWFDKLPLARETIPIRIAGLVSKTSLRGVPLSTQHDFFTALEIRSVLEMIAREYGGRIDHELAQDSVLTTPRYLPEGRLEGKRLTLEFPRLHGYRIIGIHPLDVVIAAKPKVEFVTKTEGLLIKRTRRERVESSDFFKEIRIEVNSGGAGALRYVITPESDTITLHQVMDELVAGLANLVRTNVRRQNPD